MSCVTAGDLDRLFEAILVNDVVDAAVALPETIRIDYPDAHLRDGFAISRDLWTAGFDRAALIDLLGALGRDGAIGADAQLWFKHVRAKFKHLRFAFVLYGRAHACPAAFKAVTTGMGHLQDAVRNGRQGTVRRYAAVLRLLLTRPAMRLLEREIARVDLADGGDFRAFTLTQIAELRAILETPAITAHRFHVARKIVSRQVSFHDDMRTIYPSQEHLLMSRYLSAINGLMGQYHDDLVARRTAGGLDYARDAFAIPHDIRARISALVTRFPG